MNYKLTIAILEESTCVGAFEVTVYKPLPHMEQGLMVTSWGRPLGCSDVEKLMMEVKEKEEENALALGVEGGIEEERAEVEPNA